MDEPDTAAIRAESRGNTYRYLAGIVMVLCDALDAARAHAERCRADALLQRRNTMEALAEADEHEREVGRTVVALEQAQARAEDAEAKVAYMEGWTIVRELEKAKARIAAALVIVRAVGPGWPATPLAEHVESALTTDPA